MMNKTTLFVVIGLLLCAAAYYWTNNQNEIATNTPTPSSSSQVTSVSEQQGTPKEVALLAGGGSYLDPAGVFSVLFPSDYVVDSTAENHVRIFKRGDSERPQGEISNGAMVVIETVNLYGKTLEQFVDERIATATADGTSEILEAKEKTTLNSYPAFTYAVSGFGNSPQLIAQKDTSSDFAIVLSTLIEDPESVGYQEQVDAIISTLELLK